MGGQVDQREQGRHRGHGPGHDAAATTTDQPTDATPSIRDRVLDAATEVLRVHGPSQIKARVIAEAVGGSTIAIYHHFGGVPELVDAVVARGFADLLARFRAAGELAGDPSAELFAMALTARELAHANAHLYDLMFGLSTRGTYRAVRAEPASPGARFRECYDLFIGACQRLIDSGRVRRRAPPWLRPRSRASCGVRSTVL